MNVAGLSLTLLFGSIILLCPRRWALLAMMAGVLYLTQAQEVVVFGFHLFAIRLLGLAGFIRVIIRREFSAHRLNDLDRLFFLFYGYTAIVFLIRSEVDQAYMIGSALDALVFYLAFRGLVGDIEDFKAFLADFGLLLAPYAALVLSEAITGQTPFSLLGSQEIDWARGGRPRCVGSFRNPELLGTLGSSFVPLYIALWFHRKERLLPVMAIVMCLFIIWASNSGGSWCCLGVGVSGWLLWSLRTRMKVVRRAAGLGIVLLALVMKAPIWYLLARISSVTGGDGYHRARLLDLFFQNLDKWWLGHASCCYQ